MRRSDLSEGCKALKKAGARNVYACATHAVLSGPAVERLNQSPFKSIIVTNTIPLGDKKCDKIRVVSVGGLLADCIERIHHETTVSTLFVRAQY